MELSEIRKKIDALDDELVRVFLERMYICADVAAYKREHGLPVLDAARERTKLAGILTSAPEEMQTYLNTLYTQIFELSRCYQNSLLEPQSELVKELNSVLAQPAKAFPQTTMVACQGVEGAYSQHAAEKFFKVPNIFYFHSFEGVFSAIANDMCAYGVLPVENSTAGSVNKVYDLMMQYDFRIVRSLRLKVDHALVAKPGTRIEDIREIYSHEQAINQSQEFLKTLPGVKITPVANTAVAAKMVAESERTDVAALSNRDCVSLYGLQLLREAVQDNGNNYTRFICISKQPEIFPGADRTSVMLTIPHRPGSLSRILNRLGALGVNLTKLESRPLPDRDFEFMFYFDLEVSVNAPEFLQLIAELEPLCESFHYLGSYSEVV